MGKKVIKDNKEMYTNASYVFIPFYSQTEQERLEFVEACSAKGYERIKDKFRYLLKYVTDSIGRRAIDHFRVKSDKDSGMGKWYVLENRKVDLDGVSTKHSFRFKIIDAHVYSFSTRIGIVAFRISINEKDPLMISNALYYLKKATREKFRLEGSDAAEFSLVDYATKLFGKHNYLFFLNEGQERANVMTYVEVPKPTNDEKDLMDFYKKELHYLCNCYSSSYEYDERRADKIENQFHYHSKTVTWGVTNEALTCMVCKELDKTSFIHNVFYDNFRKQYLSMYVLLLHQKYTLYMFLSRIIDVKEGEKIEVQIKQLEEYRKDLFSFEKDFMFKTAAEVPQYQSLYSKVYSSFALEDMIGDVYEPIRSISELKKDQYELEEKMRDESQNKLLMYLAFLGLASALVDSFDFIGSALGLFTSEEGITWINVLQLGCSIAMILFCGLKIFQVWKKNRDDRK